MYTQLILESNFLMVNHIIYLRQVFPYLDYYNKFLNSVGKETQVLDLRVVVYTDISNLAYQLVSQNSKQLKMTQGYRGLTAHAIRFKIVYQIVCSAYPLNESSKRCMWAERLALLDKEELFGHYKILMFYLEWLANNSANMYLFKELKDLVAKVYDKVTSTSRENDIVPEMRKVLESLASETTLVQEHQFRHEFVTLNDYVRKSNRVVTTDVDDEMVLVEIKRHFNTQGMWLENSRP